MTQNRPTYPRRHVRKLRTGLATLSLAAAALVLPASSASATTHDQSGADTAVIVTATAGHVVQARHDVEQAGGQLGADLSIINGFAAQIPHSALTGLRSAPGVANVQRDAPGQVEGSSYYPYTDAGGTVGLSSDIGYNAYWNRGYTGQGVGVAVIDSGVNRVPELAASGKVVYGPDFSPTGYFTQMRSLDGFGHGTFMAGIIAARPAGVSAPYDGNSGQFLGVAPDAKIISVKAGDEAGATTSSCIIAAIQWVVQHRADSGLNIKVLNLSLGVRDGLAYTNEPLDAAAEAAWKAGITVVASTGNDGTPGLLAPANDPYVIAVGAIDTGNTISISDDTVATFSNVGSGSRNPDFAALGTHIVSLRNPGSQVDAAYGVGPGSVTSDLMRGSGTSESAAVTSGAVALLVSQRPGITPDQVKALLKSGAWALPYLTAANSGSGSLSMSNVIDQPTPTAKQSWTSASTSLLPIADNSGGTSSSASGAVWKGGPWTSIDWTGRSWTGPTWDGSVWKGAVWNGSLWTGSVWKGSVWKGSVWNDATWQTSGWQ